ncbi:MAG: hypothetical protein HY697_01365 [Deltaproteobacteria bacterium]|nr:hypothetical protein [Deltaproteobacteria bacterium]
MTRYLGPLFPKVKNNRKLKNLEMKARQDSQNPYWQVRIADLLARMGRKEEALKLYRLASKRFQEKGFVIQAIALYKVILRLDPMQEEVRQVIDELYRRRIIQEEKEERDPQNEGAAEDGKMQGETAQESGFFRFALES